jgi:hypothetical protein
MNPSDHDNTTPRDSDNQDELCTKNQNTIHVDVEALDDTTFRPLSTAVLREIQASHRSARRRTG